MKKVIKVEDCGDHNVIIIPKGVTNGDILKTIFPSDRYGVNENEVCFHIVSEGDNGCLSLFTLDWRDAQYKAKNKK